MSLHLASLAAVGLPFLGELVALFAAGVALTWLCHRLRIVPIVGFLVAGVAIGPHAAGLVTDLELISAAAEVGVILLLFTIGVEFHLEKLARIRRVIVVGGGLQVTLTVAAVAGILALLGVAPAAGVYTGFLVALSSTVIVLKLLDDRGRTDGPSGRLALGTLIFQDLAVVLMVLLVPVLAGGATSAGEVGRVLARSLDRMRVPYRVVDLNPVSVEEARARGVPVEFGDLSRPRTLREAGVGRARLLVLALNDPDATAAAVRMARRERPDLPILVRTRYQVDAGALREAGASEVVGEEVEAASRLVERALRLTGTPAEEARRQVERLREADGVEG